MRTHEIESWALSIIDRVNAGQPIEDQRVELKSGWISPYKAARQIAALANSLRGEPGLWLIGVNEERGVEGVNFVDLASWLPQVESMFDGLAPDPTPVNVPVGGETVVALLFNTERAPFVVKVEGKSFLEVPWRGSTQTRSARREELLRILSPLQRLPDFDVFGAAVEMERPDDGKSEVWKAALKVFANTRDDNRVVIPFHRCEGLLTFPNQHFNQPFTKIQINPDSGNPGTITASLSEAILSGPGTFILRALFEIPRRGVSPGGDAVVKFKIYVVGPDQAVDIDERVPVDMLQLGRCRWGRGDAPDVFDKDAFFFA